MTSIPKWVEDEIAAFNEVQRVERSGMTLTGYPCQAGTYLFVHSGAAHVSGVFLDGHDRTDFRRGLRGLVIKHREACE